MNHRAPTGPADTPAGAFVAAWDLGSVSVLGFCGPGRLDSGGAGPVPGQRPALVAVTFCADAVITAARDGADFAQQPGELFLFDLTEPFVISWPDGARAFVIQIPHDDLGLAGDVIRRGVRTPRAHPLYALARDYVARVCAALPAVHAGPAGRVLGEVTTDLVRALIAGDGAARRAADTGTGTGAPEESLLLRIELFVRDHLSDPALSARQIAEAHFISVRQLYYLWSGRDCTLAEWITSERLAGASRELASPHSSAAIADIAQRWGFAGPAHFSRRFKARYDLTPRRWRQLHRATKAVAQVRSQPEHPRKVTLMNGFAHPDPRSCSPADGSPGAG